MTCLAEKEKENVAEIAHAVWVFHVSGTQQQGVGG